MEQQVAVILSKPKKLIKKSNQLGIEITSVGSIHNMQHLVKIPDPSLHL